LKKKTKKMKIKENKMAQTTITRFPNFFVRKTSTGSALTFATIGAFNGYDDVDFENVG